MTAQNVRAIADLEPAAKANCTLGDRVAGRITAFCGSLPFVWVHVAWFALWIAGNCLLKKPIDPYPFNFLTLVVSLEAIFLSTFIMISENRQGRVDERRSHLDLQINLLSEQENTKMLQMLEAITHKLGIGAGVDPAVTALKEATSPDALLQQIDETAEREDSDPSSNQSEDS